jgi:hypothetical protein
LGNPTRGEETNRVGTRKARRRVEGKRSGARIAKSPLIILKIAGQRTATNVLSTKRRQEEKEERKPPTSPSQKTSSRNWSRGFDPRKRTTIRKIPS